MSASSPASSSSSSSLSSSSPISTPHGAPAPLLNPSVTHVPTPLPAPIRLSGKVVRGFQRGSKQLGFPTANLDPAAFRDSLPSLPYGVYMGWAQVEEGEVHPTVLSLGTNPTFNAKEDTLEAYILHSFPHDFYGQRLQLLITAFLRPQYTLTNLDDLIAWIRQDVTTAEEALRSPAYAAYQHDPHFPHSATSLRSHV